MNAGFRCLIDVNATSVPEKIREGAANEDGPRAGDSRAPVDRASRRWRPFATGAKHSEPRSTRNGPIARMRVFPRTVTAQPVRYPVFRTERRDQRHPGQRGKHPQREILCMGHLTAAQVGREKRNYGGRFLALWPNYS
jgi:hypothetical protein